MGVLSKVTAYYPMLIAKIFTVHLALMEVIEK